MKWCLWQAQAVPSSWVGTPGLHWQNSLGCIGKTVHSETRNPHTERRRASRFEKEKEATETGIGSWNAVELNTWIILQLYDWIMKSACMTRPWMLLIQKVKRIFATISFAPISRERSLRNSNVEFHGISTWLQKKIQIRHSTLQHSLEEPN